MTERILIEFPPDEKLGMISMDEDGVRIFPCSRRCNKFSELESSCNDCPIKFNLQELAILSAIAFIYTGLQARGMVPGHEASVISGIKLYDALLGTNYENLKGIKDMTMNEFNDWMKTYDGRKN